MVASGSWHSETHWQCYHSRGTHSASPPFPTLPSFSVAAEKPSAHGGYERLYQEVVLQHCSAQSSAAPEPSCSEEMGTNSTASARSQLQPTPSPQIWLITPSAHLPRGRGCCMPPTLLPLKWTHSFLSLPTTSALILAFHFLLLTLSRLNSLPGSTLTSGLQPNKHALHFGTSSIAIPS